MVYILPILAVLLSFVFVLVTKPKNKKGIKLLLAFSGSFLLALTIFELFPEVYSNTNSKTAGIFIMLGILIQIFLEFFSKGAEHGHVHLDTENSTFPWLLLVSLCIHSFLEGFPITADTSIIYGILIHKIPIAIILSIFLIESNLKKSSAVFFILLFSLMTPLGGYLTHYYSSILAYHIEITSIVIGVFLHISTVILFESSEGHSFNLRKLLVILLGVIVAYQL